MFIEIYVVNKTNFWLYNELYEAQPHLYFVRGAVREKPAAIATNKEDGLAVACILSQLEQGKKVLVAVFFHRFDNNFPRVQ